EWNLQLLKDNFSPLDVERILSIPLSFFPSEDRLVWHHATSGIYNVKSGYHLSATLDECDQAATSDLHSSWWKTFWHLSLPSKIKIFAWKVMHNAIPTLRCITQVKSNRFCSVFAVYLRLGIYRACPFLLQAQQMFNGDYLFHLSKLFSQQDFELLICTMWAIWTSRNKALHGSSVQNGKDTATFAKGYVDKVRVHSAKPHQHATKSPGPFSAAVHSSNVQELPAATYCRIVQDPPAATSSSFAPNDHVSWHPPPAFG
uniref:Reverse transcriptase zinc-binding domain-containing protein n=1 Tax=Cannabis sativa TaxID=3483 RepID=A0A803QS43_CANSA